MNIKKKISEDISYYHEYDDFTGQLKITGKIYNHRCVVKLSREILAEIWNREDFKNMIESNILNEIMSNQDLIKEITRDIKISEILNLDLESHEKDIIFV